VNEISGEFWPHDPNVDWDSARTPFSVYDASGNLPISWRRLGVRPRWRQLFCTYLVNAGAPPPAAWAPGPLGATLWAAQPNVPWFYAVAACNLGGQAGWASAAEQPNVTVLSLTHDSPAIRTTDEIQ
jgi:hypothetical protein